MGEADKPATTPKWSDRFFPSWMLQTTPREVNAKSSLSAMWSIHFRPWKARAEVTICHARGKGCPERRSKFNGCAAAWPYGLIEVPYNYQTFRRHPSENFGETGQVLFMVFPPLLAFRIPPSLSP